jgi:hypothetical protein
MKRMAYNPVFFSGTRQVIIKVDSNASQTPLPPQVPLVLCQQSPPPTPAMSTLARSDVFPLGILTILFSWTLFVWYSGKKRFPYPPGPRRLPIVGNLFSMPSDQEWVTYRKWSDDFGTTLWCKRRRVHCHLYLNLNCISVRF